VSIAGLLAACSGSNAVVSLGDDADDASPGAEASAGDDAQQAQDTGGSQDSMRAHGDDGTDGATEDATLQDGAPADATLPDGEGSLPDADLADATRDGEGPDAAHDAASPIDAGGDAEARADAGRDAAADHDAALDHDAGTEPDATLDHDAATGPDAAPEAAAPDASGDDGGSSVADASADDAGELDAGDDAPACSPPSSPTGAFVDGANGVDDPSHGGAPGACAYRTITYALANAPRRIAVAAGTYSAATGETLPFILSGRQGLFCTDATLAGQAPYQNARATAVLTGTANTLSDCTFVGDDRSGACVLVASDGTRAGHDLEGLDVSHCGDVGVAIEGTLVQVADGFFHDSDRGVAWTTNADPTGELNDNTFANNAIEDIECTQADDNVTGGGNQDGTDVPTCDGCGMCPFP
jgi:hypothetical protein